MLIKQNWSSLTSKIVTFKPKKAKRKIKTDKTRVLANPFWDCNIERKDNQIHLEY